MIGGDAAYGDKYVSCVTLVEKGIEPFCSHWIEKLVLYQLSHPDTPNSNAHPVCAILSFLQSEQSCERLAD